MDNHQRIKKIYLLSIICFFIIYSVFINILKNKDYPLPKVEIEKVFVNDIKIPQKPIVASSSQDSKIVINGDKNSFFVEKNENPPSPKKVIKTIEIVKDELGMTAKSYLVGNVETGEIYLEKDSEKIFPIASISKLMTVIVAKEKMPLDYEIKISKEAENVFGDNGLREGMVFHLIDLIKIALVSSSNDSAFAISEAYSSSTGPFSDNFIDEMNKKAIGIGMMNTRFYDSSGLDKRNTSSSRDLFELAQFVYKNEKDLLAISKIASSSISAIGYATSTPIKMASTTIYFSNNNIFSTSTQYLGGKTGKTEEALETILSIFSPKIAIIILHSHYRNNEVSILLNWYKNNSIKWTGQ